MKGLLPTGDMFGHPCESEEVQQNHSSQHFAVATIPFSQHHR
jgi:hypothetical protein